MDQTAGNRAKLFIQVFAALLLTIVFYAMVAMGLIAPFGLPLYLWHKSGEFHVVFSIILFTIGIAFLWHLFANRRREDTPGPIAFISLRKYPLLEEMVQAVAKQAREKLPDSVCLTLQSDAWVLERGWFFNRKRIMGLGMPLFYFLTQEELKSVVAHEYGHYLGGDTGLSGWAYRHRRIVNHFADYNPLFLLYAKVFLRLIRAATQAQEIAADTFSARCTSPAIAARALRKLDEHEVIFDTYMKYAVWPALEQGYLPSILEGYELYLGDKASKELIEKRREEIRAYQDELPQGNLSYHPPLEQRLRHLESMSEETENEDTQPARELIKNWEKLEKKMLSIPNRPFLPLAWDKIWNEVHLPAMQRDLMMFEEALAGIPIRAAKALLENPRALSEKIVELSGGSPDAHKLGIIIINIVSNALVLALVEKGWRVPGGIARINRIQLTRAGRSVIPRDMVRDLAQTRMSEEAWTAFCQKEKIGDWEMSCPGRNVKDLAKVPEGGMSFVSYEDATTAKTVMQKEPRDPVHRKLSGAQIFYIIFFLSLLMSGLTRCMRGIAQEHGDKPIGRFIQRALEYNQRYR